MVSSVKILTRNIHALRSTSCLAFVTLVRILRYAVVTPSRSHVRQSTVFDNSPLDNSTLTTFSNSSLRTGALACGGGRLTSRMNSWFYFEVAHTPDNSISLCLGSLFFEFPESISKEKTIVIFCPLRMQLLGMQKNYWLSLVLFDWLLLICPDSLVLTSFITGVSCFESFSF